MNKALLLLLIYFGLLLPKGYSQICVPDVKFQQAIKANCPTCLDSDGCLVPAVAKNLDELFVASGFGVTDITGIEGFVNLHQFICTGNEIAFVPPLPDSLTQFYCSDNLITTLPAKLPYNLKEFKCENNLISTIPSLPDKLELLFCSNNNLTSLPPLPQKLDNLTCNDNMIVQLPILPESLTSLHCNQNPIKNLPVLPDALEKLYCSQDSIFTLPELPASLKVLDVSKNPISCLPEIPYDLQFFDYTFTYITCLPNPIGISTTLPLCVNSVDDSCAINPEITGTVYVDYNGDHIKNIEDIGFPQVNVVTNSDNWVGYTNASGLFDMNAGFSQTYNFTIQPVNGLYDIWPPAGYSLGFDDSTNQKIDNINFWAHPDPTDYDLEVVLVGGPLVADAQTNYYLICRNNGPFAFDGSALLQYDISVNYLGASIPPSSQTTGSLSWDFTGLQPFQSKTIIVTFSIPGSLNTGTKIYMTATGSITSSTDVFPENNVVEDSTKVISPSSLNYKAVNLDQITPQYIADGVALDYTIYFQNSGNGTAHSVIITDSLSSNLVASQFELLGSSHPNAFELKNDPKSSGHPLVLMWNFTDIDLPSAVSDPLASRGFVKYRIKPSPSLVIGNLIENKANIQISNADGIIVTNKVITQVVNVISVWDPSVGMLDLNVFPNPSDGMLNVQLSAKETGNREIKIYNLLGELVWNHIIPGKNEVNIPVDISDLPAGPYLMEVTCESACGKAKIWKQ